MSAVQSIRETTDDVFERCLYDILTDIMNTHTHTICQLDQCTNTMYLQDRLIDTHSLESRLDIE